MKPLIIANWKCNPASLEEANDLIKKVEAGLDRENVVICPPSIFLSSLTEESGLPFGAQNCYSEKGGAFTGEISIPMIEDAGAEYVIIGHSERRRIFKESDKEINQKLLAVLNSKITPILCFGESSEDREEGRTFEVIFEQLTKCLSDVPEERTGKIVLAYEPVWAIGTGKSAEVSEIEEVRNFIKQFLSERFSNSEGIKIVYGGSVDSSNVYSFIHGAQMDGVLVGGASLNAEEFLKMIKSV